MNHILHIVRKDATALRAYIATFLGMLALYASTEGHPNLQHEMFLQMLPILLPSPRGP